MILKQKGVMNTWAACEFEDSYCIAFSEAAFFEDPGHIELEWMMLNCKEVDEGLDGLDDLVWSPTLFSWGFGSRLRAGFASILTPGDLVVQKSTNFFWFCFNCMTLSSWTWFDYGNKLCAHYWRLCRFELQSISISFHGKPILQLQGCSCSSCCPHDGTTGRGLASVRRQRDHEHATKCVVVDEAENSRINGHCAKSNQFLICYCTASIAILSV